MIQGHYSMEVCLPRLLECYQAAMNRRSALRCDHGNEQDSSPCTSQGRLDCTSTYGSGRHRTGGREGLDDLEDSGSPAHLTTGTSRSGANEACEQ
jgi:hypothetical protein